jgi:predicted transcriptional regulator
MGLTNEVDTSLLHQCFELKPDYMDAIRKRREYLIWEAQVEAEKKRIEFLKQMKQETMNCHAISQRITLQEYLVEGSEEILKEIDEWMADDEKIKTLNKQQVDAMIDTWLANFKILQPS